MIVLDTNVLSELVRPRPARGVVEWVDRIESSELMITAVTAAELRVGIAQLPNGQRKIRISGQVEALIAETFVGYVLPFDVISSEHYADIVAMRRSAGRPISALDAQIAAICRQHSAMLATRNIQDFAGTGVDVVDPWDAV
jgi:toxin FitB